MARFADVLTIINGKNQKHVENPNGKYPIYGSGGIMGYADDFICSGETVIIGRKGNINKPIFVDVPFWNVDTAFGLSVKQNMLLPKYLFYFCEIFNFESLNTTVTIPSLTKANLLDVEIPLPTLEKQREIVITLDKCNDLIDLRKQQLAKLDESVKARFVEMFGDPICNRNKLPTERGVDFFKLSNGKFLPESKRFESGIPAYGGNGISWYTDDAIMKEDTLVVGRVGFQSGNVHFAKGPLWITDNAMYISEYNMGKFNLFFLYALIEHIDFTRFQDAGDLKKVTQKPFMNMEYIMPALSQQQEYVSFAKRSNKSKLTIQQSLDKMEMLKKALMQEYFE